MHKELVFDSQIDSPLSRQLLGTPLNGSYETALRLAVAAHTGQFDKAGSPYLHHVLRVSNKCASYGDDAKIIGLLHDAMEDCSDVTVELLQQLRFSQDIIDALVALIRPREQTIAEKVDDLIIAFDVSRSMYLAAIVKLYDLQDNANTARYKTIDAYQTKRCAHYQKQYEILLKALVNIISDDTVKENRNTLSVDTIP